MDPQRDDVGTKPDPHNPGGPRVLDETTMRPAFLNSVRWWPKYGCHEEDTFPTTAGYAHPVFNLRGQNCQFGESGGDWAIDNDDVSTVPVGTRRNDINQDPFKMCQALQVLEYQRAQYIATNQFIIPTKLPTTSPSTLHYYSQFPCPNEFSQMLSLGALPVPVGPYGGHKPKLLPGCGAPSDSKFEGTFYDISWSIPNTPAVAVPRTLNMGKDTFDLSLVDGWTLPFTAVFTDNKY